MSSESTAISRIWPSRQTEQEGRSTLHSEVDQSYRHHFGSVRRYAYAIVRRLPEADDIAQECFVRLLQSRTRGIEIECPLAWLLRVAHNLALDRLGERAPEVSMEATRRESMICSLPNPEQATVKSQERQRVLDALSQLSSQELRCWTLRSEGMRYREIAEILGVQTGTVATFLVRATEKLSAHR